MKKEFKTLTIKLSNHLSKQTAQFLLDNLDMNIEYNIKDLIDLILSSHLTSLMSKMNDISEGHPEINKTVRNFLNDLLNYIEKLHPIQKLEVFS
jgi:hypothetical protein